MEVRKIETIFERVQARIGILQYRDHEIYGLEETVDWTSGHWRIVSLLDQKIASQFTSKVQVFSDSVLGGKCQEHLEEAKTWETDRTREVVQSPEDQPYYDVTGTPMESVWKIYVGKTTIEILERIKNYDGGKRNTTSSISRQNHFDVHLTTTSEYEQNN